MSRLIGKEGEDSACRVLIASGYTILRRNFTSRYGELDIVAQDPDGVLVFVEVKSYKMGSLLDPVLSITPKKIKKILMTIRYYQLCFDVADVPSRIDVMIMRNGACVDHLLGAIYVC